MRVHSWRRQTCTINFLKSEAVNLGFWKIQNLLTQNFVELWENCYEMEHRHTRRYCQSVDSPGRGSEWWKYAKEQNCWGKPYVAFQTLCMMAIWGAKLLLFQIFHFGLVGMESEIMTTSLTLTTSTGLVQYFLSVSLSWLITTITRKEMMGDELNLKAISSGHWLKVYLLCF